MSICVSAPGAIAFTARTSMRNQQKAYSNFSIRTGLPMGCVLTAQSSLFKASD